MRNSLSSVSPDLHPVLDSQLRLACLLLAGLVNLACATGTVERKDDTGEEADVPLEPGSTSVHLELDTRFQTLEGFGAAAAWYAEWLSTHPNRDEMYDLLFPELGLDLVRFRNVFRYNPDNFDAAQSSADIFREGSRALGRDLAVLISSWSPPADLKANGEEDCSGSGESAPCTLIQKDGEFAYDEFGQYWQDSLDAYAAIGIQPTYISIQNEPDFTPTGWEGCVFRPTENGGYPSYAKALDAVVGHLAGRETLPKLLGPETIGTTPSVLDGYAEQMDSSQIYGWAHHLYDGNAWTRPDTLRAPMRTLAADLADKPRFMTEFSSGCSTADAECDPSEGSFETAWLIHNSLVEENVSAYVYWELIWDRKGLLAVESPLHPEYWTTEKGFEIRPHYYSLKHYARYTDPGDVRVGAASDDEAVRASAFLNPDEDRLTLVLLNVAQEYSVDLDVSDFDFSQSAIYQTTTDEPWQELDPFEEGTPLVLPHRSITTLVFTQ